MIRENPEKVFYLIPEQVVILNSTKMFSLNPKLSVLYCTVLCLGFANFRSISFAKILFGQWRSERKRQFLIKFYREIHEIREILLKFANLNIPYSSRCRNMLIKFNPQKLFTKDSHKTWYSAILKSPCLVEHPVIDEQYLHILTF